MGWKFLLIVPIAFFAGCATAPKYQDYRASDAACIKGDLANFFKFFGNGEAHVGIKEIDGVATGGGTKYFCFSPGAHTLGVFAGNGSQTASEYVKLDFEAGRKYWLRAHLRGISMAFDLYDVTVEPMVKVNEFKVKVNGSSQPVTIPIFIPAR